MIYLGFILNNAHWELKVHFQKKSDFHKTNLIWYYHRV